MSETSLFAELVKQKKNREKALQMSFFQRDRPDGKVGCRMC